MKIDHKYLPSRKFIIILSSVVAVALIAVAISFVGKGNYTATNNDNLVSTASSTSFEAFKQADSDHDGLPDWQEALYGTDAHKIDTDSDGTPDGEEVNINRDPLIANTAPKGQEPSDKISAEVIAKDQQNIKEYESLSLTDRMSRDILSQYLATKQMGSNLSATDKELIMLNSLPQITVKKYTVDDLKTYSATNTQAETRKYLNNVGAIIFEASSLASKYKIQNEYIILEKAMATSNGDVLKGLDPTIAILIAEINSLLTLPISEDFTEIHLNLINTIGSKIVGLEGLKNMFSDPIKAMLLLKNYQDGDDGMYGAIQSFATLADKQKLSFSTKEYGYYLINMIK